MTRRAARAVALAAGLLVAWSPAALPAQAAPATAGAQAVVPAAAPFGVGEVLEYKISYAFLEAGSLRLTVDDVETVDGRPAYRLVSRAETNRAVSTLYSLQDHLRSWMDVERLHSLRFLKESVEKGKHRDRSYRLDQTRGLRVNEETGEEQPMPAGAQDDLSIFYFLRTLPLQDGRRITLNVLMDPDDNPMRVTVLGREELKVPAGRFDTLVLKLDVHTDSGVFSQGGELRVWMSDDARRVPVKLESKLAVGSFTAELTRLVPGRPVAGGALSSAR